MPTAYTYYAITDDIVPPTDMKCWKQFKSDLDWNSVDKDIAILHSAIYIPGKGLSNFSSCGVDRNLMMKAYSGNAKMFEHQYIEPAKSHPFTPIASAPQPRIDSFYNNESLTNIHMTLPTLEQLIGTLVYAPSEIHVCHLRTESWRNHLVLDELYKELPEEVDSIIEAIYAEVKPLQKFENVLHESDYESSLDYLTALRAFVVASRNLFDSNKHSNILATMDNIQQMIDTSVYKITKLKEGLDEYTFASSEAERQFKNGILSHGGRNVKAFFDTKAPEISLAIEQRLNRPYRYVNRDYCAIFYSKLTKLFVTVFKSYRQDHYAIAAMPMITFYNPEILTNATFIKATNKKELIEEVKKFSASYTPIYVDI